MFRVRDGEKRQSETNVFVFRFFRRGSAGGFVSSGGKGARRRSGWPAVVVAAVGMKYKELAMTVGGTVLAVIGAGVYYYFYY